MGPQRTSTAGQQRSSSRGRLPMGAQREQPLPARENQVLSIPKAPAAVPQRGRQVREITRVKCPAE